MARTAQHTRRTIITHDINRDDADYADDYVASQSVAARIVWFVAGVIIAFLALRFILSLLGANTTNPFASFIYYVSHPFVAPFFGLFHYNVVSYGVSRFEVYTLVSIIVYALIAWAISYLLTIDQPYQE